MQIVRAFAYACKSYTSGGGVVLEGQQGSRPVLLEVHRIYDLPVASEAVAERICVVQPFSNLLIAQSNPVGPERGQISQETKSCFKKGNIKRMLRVCHAVLLHVAAWTKQLGYRR